ncbi:MAG: hypothetical protein ACXACX_11965 [Candidatus Hodarchaeales archaeon]
MSYMKIQIFEYGKGFDRKVQFFSHITDRKKKIILAEDRTIDTFEPEHKILKQIQDYINKNEFRILSIKEANYKDLILVRFYIIKD